MGTSQKYTKRGSGDYQYVTVRDFREILSRCEDVQDNAVVLIQIANADDGANVTEIEAYFDAYGDEPTLYLTFETE